MQEYSHNKQTPTNFIFTLIRKFNPNILKNKPRPTELPPAASDCGWNHGEQDEK